MKVCNGLLSAGGGSPISQSLFVLVDRYLTFFLLEGKNLKGVESNGTSDPLFQIYVDGKNRNLESKHISGTLAPIVRYIPTSFQPFHPLGMLF